MSLNKGTFPPHQQPSGVLAIRPSSENHEIVSMEVSDQFPDSEHFKDALRNFAIKRNFNFTFIKNDKQRVNVKCAVEGCEWRVHASMEDNEMDANWMWFLSKLGDTIYDDDEYVKIITFISDRSKGLINVVAKVFPSSPHAYCLRHLEANFMKANVRLEFDDAVANLLNTSADAHQWLMQKSDLAHWANYMFKGDRWGEMYSNVSESFNAWIKEARHLPVTNMVDSIRFKLMGMLCHRREQSQRWERRICPVIHRKIEELVEESRNLLVGRSDGDHFEVVDQKNYCISLNARTCSCRRWQVYGIPCKHACAAILQTDTNIHRYIVDYFTVDSYRQAYAEAIFPVPDNDKPDDINRELLVRPPITKKPVGRLRRKRLGSQPSSVHELRCSRCHDAGHNSRSCNVSIAD
ncbi:uncharacterized protein LOC120249979 [Dioscorea cayenensis subsp. rotundata]|uniref:Uncharacterized protein LOC120249979 n=1 Tax=Dioscorea cayennensis subsp. rotundata TaxID=55577 RepID=A0AB40AI59_DIOCR|nr:uncharacterized protein LOC120249979 [Dioscorea cayenensis subsp. rotundata]